MVQEVEDHGGKYLWSIQMTDGTVRQIYADEAVPQKNGSLKVKVRGRIKEVIGSDVWDYTTRGNEERE